MRIRPVALAAVPVVLGLFWMAAPVSALATGHPHGRQWTTERRWSPRNDWEPNIAADPSSPWL